MRKTKFSLIVDKVNDQFIYKCGFKNESDAELYKNKYGGKIDTIEVLFYDDFHDSESHQKNIKEANESLTTVIQSISKMDDELRQTFLANIDDNIKSELLSLLK